MLRFAEVWNGEANRVLLQCTTAGMRLSLSDGSPIMVSGGAVQFINVQLANLSQTSRTQHPPTAKTWSHWSRTTGMPRCRRLLLMSLTPLQTT